MTNMTRHENACTAVPAADASVGGNFDKRKDAKRPLTSIRETMQSIFALADDIHSGLASIQPRLSEHQLEQVIEVLVGSLRNEGIISVIAPAVPESFLQDSCSELWARLALDSGVSAAWVTLVIRILFVLCEKADLDREPFLAHVWRMVAYPAEELSCGLGQAIMRASIESTLREITTNSTEGLGHEGGTVAGDHLKLLMEWVVSTLGRDGNLPPLSTTNLDRGGGGGQETRIIPSQSGMWLAIDIASQTIAILRTLDATHHGLGFGHGDGILQALRQDIHLEVMRLLRDCRLEGVRRRIIVTITGPLYQGWGDMNALEDLWHFISSADDQSVELHVALLCLLAEDFFHFLGLPARHAQGFWDLIHMGMSNRSDLARRRSLHLLQKVLALTDESVNGDESLTKNVKEDSSARSLQNDCSGSTGNDTPRLKGFISGDALVQWKDYARVMEVLEMETEVHLLDQVVPTVERLCAKLSENSAEDSCSRVAYPMVTEFRWMAIPLGMLITSGTIVRRRALISRIILRNLGQQTENDDEEGEGEACALSKVDETWVVQVLVPALDQVGWHSSTSKASLQTFTRSVTEFLRSFVRTLSAPRMVIFLELLLRAIRERTIGSTGALFALLASLDLDGAKMPALGPHALFQLKEMLVAILPPLNQAKRIFLLDGVTKILEAFTDYENPALYVHLGNEVCPSRSGDGNISEKESSPQALEIVMDILSAIPGDLITHRYLPQLARWVSNFRCRHDSTSENQDPEEHVLWSVEFKGRVEAYLSWRKRRNTAQTGTRDGKGRNLEKQSVKGRKLGLLGLVLSEGFASKKKRGEVLADGLSLLVKVLRQCWKEPYIAAETVEAALSLFSAWVKVSDADHETRLWRRRPLEASLEEVINLVTARLKSTIDIAQRRYGSNGTLINGDEAQILLRGLEAAMECARDISHNRTTRNILGAAVDPLFHPEVVDLRDICASLLTSFGLYPVAPAAHLLAVASLEIIARAEGQAPRFSLDVGYQTDQDQRRFIDSKLSLSRAEDIVRSLLLNNVEGRVTSPDESLGLLYGGSSWADISKQHEQRKWGCLSILLPSMLREAGTSDTLGGEKVPLLSGDPPLFDALVEGIRASSREEMPLAVASFQTAFPWYIQSLSHDQQAAEFTRVFKLVWSTITEAPRPQFSLVRDVVSAVLHPVHLAMPELYSIAASPDQIGAASCIAGALKSIVAFGVANRPSVLRALAGRLADLWRLSPGGLFHLVPEILELLLFKEWGQGIENVSNKGSSTTDATAEAPRLMLLLLLEKEIIPSAAKGGNLTDMRQKEQLKESRQILRSLILGLMDLHNSKEFRQAGITDQLVYGRKLRSWQALCILCGYFCVVPAHSSASAHVEDGDMSEIVEAVSKWFWSVHSRTALPAIRQHMEVFAVRMCQAHPDLFVPAAIKQLSDVRLPGQVLCSLLIIAGHLLVGRKPLSSPIHRLDLFKTCLPWMVGTHVMGRMIAQFICHSLLPEVPVDLKGTYLEKLFSFLDDNADMVAMRERQLESFRRTDCATMCTVKGLLEAHGSGHNGEITPTHMCELLQETMDEIWNETQQDKTRALEEGRFWLQTTAEVEKGTWFDTDKAVSIPGVDGHIQQKIIPWDKLDLALDQSRSASLEQSTAAGRTRQPVVMCATLVDKVPNLAGLARTCEIFAVSSLLVSDVRVVKNPSFSKISMGAEQWLPIGELREKQLLPWLRKCKKQGYTLVGIEQTNNSVCLTKVKFPRRCVLVLGREHSGLPLPVINEMDLCCQIPQQGILRSLNAHVSGGLVLWEYTRQMLETGSY